MHRDQRCSVCSSSVVRFVSRTAAVGLNCRSQENNCWQQGQMNRVAQATHDLHARLFRRNGVHRTGIYTYAAIHLTSRGIDVGIAHLKQGGVGRNAPHYLSDTMLGKIVRCNSWTYILGLKGVWISVESRTDMAIDPGYNLACSHMDDR